MKNNIENVDSCPIEGFIQEKAEILLREKFGVDTKKYGLSYMVAFGYRKKKSVADYVKTYGDVAVVNFKTIALG